MVFDSLGYNHTDQEGKNRINPNRSPLKGQGSTGLSNKFNTFPFINR